METMKNKKGSRNIEKYGETTVGETLKLLIDIIGPKVVFDRKSKFYESILREMDKGKIPYHNVAILQRYCERFFKEIESNYEVSPFVKISLISNLNTLIRDFSLYTKSNIILDMSNYEIVLFLLHGQAFHYIDDNSSKKDWLSDMDMNVFKVSEKKVLEFLTDSYKIVFDEIMQVFENNETFYNEFHNFYKENNKPETDLETDQKTNYKQNIHNWQNEIVYNPYWQKLVPVLDYLYKQKHIAFVHRLIRLYLRKNAQEAFAKVFGISKNELKEIIEETANMIREKRHPEKIRSDLYFDDIWINNQRIRIIKCLEFQNNYENSIDVIKSNNITKYLENNYFSFSEEKFLCFWLQTRAKVFEKYIVLKDYKEEILKGYRKAFDKLLNDTEGSPFLTQFLTEIILINDFFNPRRVKAINDYYEYGCTLEIFNADKKNEVLSRIRKFLNKDIRKSLVDIHSKFCPIKTNS